MAGEVNACPCALGGTQDAIEKQLAERLIAWIEAVLDRDCWRADVGAVDGWTGSLLWQPQGHAPHLLSCLLQLYGSGQCSVVDGSTEAAYCPVLTLLDSTGSDPEVSPGLFHAEVSVEPQRHDCDFLRG